ncbi:MAG TPA: haloalkane dehalogenase [Ilumatobacteraceae bacterium]|nr:haloalkane dehalogenase [Ilumatobacteraceae bacterium]HRB04939.1 haloalkane dehalogenase [Ilumatobacteraceae bacterium]
MQSLRTPDDRFVDLPDYPFAPHYAEVPAVADDPSGGTLRVHYIDEGPRDAPPVLLMHGEPSWSFLYRHMIPVLVAAGHRVIAPDLVGFGKSDKPTETSDYTYARHVGWMQALLFDHLDLRGITFFGQDWGGLVGLRALASAPDRYARAVVGNTGLPEGDGKLSDAFLSWQKFSRESEAFPIGGIVNGGCATNLSPEVIAAYDAPFPDDSYKAGARIFPTLVPSLADDPGAAENREAWKVLEAWEKPWLCAFSDKDAVTRGGEGPFLRRIPGTKGQPHTTIVGGGHFLQEDKGPELAQVIVGFIAATPVVGS